MSGNWNDPFRHYQSHPQHHQQHSQSHSQQQPNREDVRLPPISTLHGAESIMGMYPLASVTPVNHAARHLMTATAPMPSFMRPQNTSSSSSLSGAMNLPPAPLAAPAIPDSGTLQRQYWDNQQHQAARLLEQQRAASSMQQGYSQHQQQDRHYPHQQQQQPSRMGYQQSQQQQMYSAPAPPTTNWAQSTYRTNPFASSILESAPYASSSSSAYYASNQPRPAAPTPTPSSLSFALREPPQQLPPAYAPQQHQHHQKPARPQYPPSESVEFLEEYLSQKGLERQAAIQQQQQQPPQRPDPPRPQSSTSSVTIQSTPTPPPKQKIFVEIKPRTPPKPPTSAFLSVESPDPLSMDAHKRSIVTPQKRKYEEPLVSPTIRRLQSIDGIRPSPVKSAKPSSSTSSASLTASGRKRMEVYVEVPPVSKTWSTPTHHSQQNRKHLGKNDTPGQSSSAYRGGRMGSVFSDVTKADDTSDDEMALGSMLKPGKGNMLKDSGIRTGDRDERGPLEKLTELLEDIFEAEDSLPADGAGGGVSESQLSGFFSRLTIDYANPLLSISIIEKLTKAIGAVAKPAKRSQGTPAANRASLADLDVGILSRMLKLLGRSVKLGEDLDPFVGPPALSSASLDVKPASTPSKSKKKAPSKKKPNSADRQHSKTPLEDEESTDVSHEDVVKLDRCLQTAKEAVLAANSCLALLSADKLPKQLYAEELITSCLATVKNQFTQVIFPFTEATSDLHGQVSAILMHVVREDDSAVRICRQTIGDIFQSLSAAMPRINGLISRTDLAMSESIIIQTIYIAIGPFFSVDSGNAGSGSKDKDKNSFVLAALGGAAALRALRLSSLSLIRSIFAYYPEQRSGIIEEILSSLIQVPNLKSKSGQFKLRDGHSIHTISALLLQLVQTSAHDVRVAGQRFAKARRQSLANGTQTSNDQSEETFLSATDKEEIDMYNSALDSPNNAAKSIIAFLTTRTGKGKLTKSTKEADYRAIFDNLLQDLLTVLYWPEWPAAALLLGVATKYLVSALDDVKSTAAVANDSNGAKSMALDHLGVIGARLRSTMLKQRRSDDGEDPLLSLDELVAKPDDVQLDRLITAHNDVVLHLVKRSSEDQAYDSARELTATMWGQDLAKTLSRCDSLIFKMMSDGSEASEECQSLFNLALRIKSTLHDVWKEPTADVFDVGTEAEVHRLDGLAEELGTLQKLMLAQEAIVNVILSSLGAPVVFMRTKGLRALGQVINADPDVLRKANVRSAIENHLHDQSPAVRDAAVELIGKYILQSPELAADYYKIISDRIADTGVSVRKRIIKLLKTMYDGAGNDKSRQIDICIKLVSRMSDDDDGVKDLAVKALEELWLAGVTSPAAGSSGDGMATRWTAEDQANSTAAIIMGVAGHFAERQSPLEDLFHQIATAKESKDTTAILLRYEQICNALIGSLVDAQAYDGFNLVSCIKTVHMLVSAHPSIISLANARSLLPYLKNTATKEDQAIADYIMKIYSACIPHLPKTSVQFAQELQVILAGRIQKPTNPSVLPECMACFCAVVKCLTHDFARVVGLLKSCTGRVRAITQRPETVTGQGLRPLIIIVFMISLLCENCDFDALRSDHAELAADIDSVSKGPIADHVYAMLLSLYDMFPDPAARGPLLRCLGYLFRAQPTLMTRPQSAAMMDAVFQSTDEEAKGRLLKIMQNFLISECEKHAAIQKTKSTKTKAINMDELVGNTDGFAESGVSSAIVQRYLPQILDAALSLQVRIQAMAVDILGFTIRQGLAHPLQCLPVIVALETSSNNNLSARANALHAILYSKHASLVNSRFLECARKSFEYQMSIHKGVVQGYRLEPTPTSLLHRWYSHVREKRTTRQDFLKAIVKSFDMDATQLKADKATLDFVRYMAENLSAFDYKTQEEVLTIIKHLTAILSVAGMQVLATWSPTLEALAASGSMNAPPPMDVSDIPFALASVILGMLMLLKAHLKAIYGITEDKCAKWIPGKKSALGDKAVTRRLPEAVLTWERLPYAVKPILVADDVARQREEFIALWEADGVQPEPVDMD